jgi:hypothetical protein
MLLSPATWEKHKLQQHSSPSESAAPSDAENRNQNIQGYIELMRADVRHQKAELLGAVMVLSASDAAKFWPIYNDYEVQLTKLNDQRVANIMEYAKAYDQMTDEKADSLIQTAMDYQKDRAVLLAKTYQQVKGAIGATQAARFVQVEHQLLLIIDLQIAASLPVIGEVS